MRSSGSGRRRTGPSTPSTTRVIRGFDAFAAGKAKIDLGDRDPRSPHDRVQPHAADRGLPVPAGAAGGRSDPGRGREMLRRASRQVRPATSSRPGPTCSRAPTRSTIRSCSTLKRMSGLGWALQADARPEPELRPEDGLTGGATEPPGRVRASRSTRASSDIVDRVAAGDLDDEAAASLPAQTLEKYSQDPAKRKYLHISPADGTSVHHDEPDPAALRRHPRSAGR